MLQVAEPTKQKSQTIATAVSPHKRAAEWVAERVQRGKKEPFTEIITLTPDIAEILLANNADNRNLKPRLVETFASDIEGKRWDLNGETIIVAKDGALNDGQHRCQAVVQAGKSIRTAIMFGVDRNSRYTVDMGAARTAGDFLSMEGATNTSIAASVAKNLNMHRRGYENWTVGTGEKSGMSTPSKTMIRQEYWDNQKQIDEAVRICINKTISGFGAASLATAYVLIMRKNAIECAAFFSRLIDGVGLRRSEPTLVLRNRILADIASRGSKARVKMQPHHRVELVIRHWNAHRKGLQIKTGLPILGRIPQIEG